MRRSPAPSAAAACIAVLALLTTADVASALPPEPASAPAGAHVAAGPPPAAIADSGPHGRAYARQLHRSDRHHLGRRGGVPASAIDRLQGQCRGNSRHPAPAHARASRLLQGQAAGRRPTRRSRRWRHEPIRGRSDGRHRPHRGGRSGLLHHPDPERAGRLHELRQGHQHHHPDRQRGAGPRQERGQGRQAGHVPATPDRTSSSPTRPRPPTAGSA